MAEKKVSGKDNRMDGAQALPVVKISVRQMVEFLLRSGDIDSRVPAGRDTEAMLAGSRIHKKLQKEGGALYSAEVSMHTDKLYDGFTLHVEGRADGVIDNHDNSPVTIDEIKGMYLDVNLLDEPIPVHLAQAKCYAAMYADALELSGEESHEESVQEADAETTEPMSSQDDQKVHGETAINVRMTYVNLDHTSDVRRFHFTYKNAELIKWYDALLDDYAVWAAWQVAHRKSRDASMQDLAFPFPYRKGQRDLTAAVYHTIAQKKELFLMAPTGVGKTMSCIFPAVRALGEGKGDRLVYMTAKNATLASGSHALNILKDKGLDIRAVRITAKEKICPQGVAECTPEACPRAKGHYDRVNSVLLELLKTRDIMEQDDIKKAAEEGNVCPFHLELDAAVWSDAILCDYNYIFDPTARLASLFSTKSDTIFLIDEAHNLVERGREMYSAALTKENVLAAKRLVKGHKRLENALKKLNDLMLGMRREVEDVRYFVIAGMPGMESGEGEERRLVLKRYFDRMEFAVLCAYEEMQNLYRESDDGALKEKLLDFYFELGSFMNRMEVLDENSVVYVENEEERHGKDVKKTFVLHLFCVTPARFLTECIDMGRSAIFFSATMLPIDYYKQMLLAREDPWAIYAESPFSREKRAVMAAGDVSTRYRLRGREMYRKIAAYLHAAAAAHRGNYIAFFPSYAMLRDVFEVYRSEFDTADIDWVVQSPYMGEADREIFLENFYEDPRRSLIAFTVMGGIFSEGIDLVGTRLVGAIIVGLGLPQVSPRQEILKNYYDGQGRDGFAYAYLYPGMNKVEQAAGRVIRTSTDTGVILLLDSRFNDSGVRRHFPREWTPVTHVTLDSLPPLLNNFWQHHSSPEKIP